MKKKNSTLLKANNIACVVMIVVLLVTLLLPSWDFIAHIKTKDYTCRECGFTLRADKLEDDFACPNDVEKVVITDGEEVTKEVITEDTVVADGAEIVTEECGAAKGRFKGTTIKEEHATNASVLEYTWLTFNCEDLTKIFEAEGMNLNDIVLAPFLLTLCSILGIVFCLVNINGCWQSIFPTVSSIVMLTSLLTIPAFKEGPYWLYSVIACAGLLAVSLALFAQFVIVIVKWCTVPVKR